MESGAARQAAVDRLDPFIGEWRMTASFPPGQPGSGVVGRTVFERALGGQILVQRAEVPHPDAPDVLAIISRDPGGEEYSQHYFDSRGVVRLYAMTFSGGVWTLLRDSPDFSPLDFSQRFTGTFSADGRTIRGRWEASADGLSWRPDFDLTYTKAS